jgi:molecular chaperone GrpE
MTLYKQKNKEFDMERQEKNTQTNEEYQDSSQPVEEEVVELEDNLSDAEIITEDLTKQIEALQDKLLRQMAESENVRNRSTKLVEEAREYAIFGFAKDLIPVMDNLSRALEHLPENLDDDVKNVVEGIEMTKKEFESVFDRNLLESIAPQTGDKFDYHSHHAISQVVTDEYKPGTIVNTMQIGYRIKERLIRPAAVTVAKNS